MVIAGTKQTIIESGPDKGSLSEVSNVTEVNFESINYKSAVAQYSTKMEFLLYLTMVSHNPEFVSALADLIKDTKIEVTIFENVSTNEEYETYTYDLNTRTETTLELEDGRTEPGFIKSNQRQSEVTKTTTINTIPSTKVTYAKTWYGEETVSYEKNTKDPVTS